MNYKVIGQQGIPKNKGVISDCHIRFTGFYKRKEYPAVLRLVTYVNRETSEEHVFLTNNFKLSSRTIADLYKSRWEVETFSKWIKQNLKIKSFLGTSKNAVMTQIWAAMIYYLLLSFIKFQTKCRHSLHELTRIVGELFLDNKHLIETLTITFDKYKRIKSNNTQLAFW